MGTMDPHRSARSRALPLLGLTVLLLALAGCSGDDDGTGASPPAPGSDAVTEPGSYGEVRPDISPQGYAALGCSVHASQATLDPTDLISRHDPREAAYAATWSLLVAAGVWDDAAFGAMVEPASGLQLVHPQGDWDRVADRRSAVTRQCRDVGRVAIGPHVYAAYACRILDRLGEVAPTVHDLAPDRLTPAADEFDALTHLARAAAAADPQYQKLGRAGELLHSTVATEAGSQPHGRARKQVAATCADLDAAG